MVPFISLLLEDMKASFTLCCLPRVCPKRRWLKRQMFGDNAGSRPSSLYNYQLLQAPALAYYLNWIRQSSEAPRVTDDNVPSVVVVVADKLGYVLSQLHCKATGHSQRRD
jgi:hypothetical protein